MITNNQIQTLIDSIKVSVQKSVSSPTEQSEIMLDWVSSLMCEIPRQYEITENVNNILAYLDVYQEELMVELGK
jgi:hypothetical protein